jgi:hypothetical protein
MRPAMILGLAALMIAGAVPTRAAAVYVLMWASVLSGAAPVGVYATKKQCEEAANFLTQAEKTSQPSRYHCVNVAFWDWECSGSACPDQRSR